MATASLNRVKELFLKWRYLSGSGPYSLHQGDKD
jgi:hypothetical protein